MKSLRNSFTLISLSMLLAVSLIGCSQTSLKPDQKVEIGPYVIVLSEACVDSKKMSVLSDENKIIACNRIAQKTLNSSKQYLTHFKYDDMREDCKGKLAVEFTTCLMNYQKNFYHKRVSRLIGDTYK
jgi:hypothetical protein